MTRVTAADLNRLAGQLSAAAELMRGDPDCKCGHKTRAEHALHVARCAHGVSVGQGSGRGSKGDHADPTYSQANKPDPSDRWLPDLSAYAHGTSRFAVELARMVHDLGTITPTSPRELSQTGSGDCAACGRYCSGSATDRLVAGMCDTDYRRWCRHGRPDRFEFCRDTPAHDAQAEAAS